MHTEITAAREKQLQLGEENANQAIEGEQLMRILKYKRSAENPIAGTGVADARLLDQELFGIARLVRYSEKALPGVGDAGQVSTRDTVISSRKSGRIKSVGTELKESKAAREEPADERFLDAFSVLVLPTMHLYDHGPWCALDGCHAVRFTNEFFDELLSPPFDLIGAYIGRLLESDSHTDMRALLEGSSSPTDESGREVRCDWVPKYVAQPGANEEYQWRLSRKGPDLSILHAE